MAIRPTTFFFAITFVGFVGSFNRPGKMEAAGAGSVEEVKRAVAADIPMLIAVTLALLGVWTRSWADMSVKLACSREPIDAS